MKQTFKQTTSEILYNEQTGEVIKQEKTSNYITKNTSLVEAEPEYIKLYTYTNTLFSFMGINTDLTKYIIEISKYMTYANKGQTVTLTRFQKQEIADTLKVSLKRIDQIIAELVKNNILKRIQAGVFQVNPHIVSKGAWGEVKNLQAQFDFDTNELTTSANLKNKITGETIHRIVTNSKKQIKGQLEMFSNDNNEIGIGVLDDETTNS